MLEKLAQTNDITHSALETGATCTLLVWQHAACIPEARQHATPAQELVHDGGDGVQPIDWAGAM